MDSNAKILLEILNLTMEIKNNYPELYPYLNENPLTIPKGTNSKIDDSSLNEYLQTLKILLKNIKKNVNEKTPKN